MILGFPKHRDKERKALVAQLRAAQETAEKQQARILTLLHEKSLLQAELQKAKEKR